MSGKSFKPKAIREEAATLYNQIVERTPGGLRDYITKIITTESWRIDRNDKNGTLLNNDMKNVLADSFEVLIYLFALKHECVKQRNAELKDGALYNIIDDSYLSSILFEIRKTSQFKDKFYDKDDHADEIEHSRCFLGSLIRNASVLFSEKTQKHSLGLIHAALPDDNTKHNGLLVSDIAAHPGTTSLQSIRKEMMEMVEKAKKQQPASDYFG